jgi:peptide/nickel transport system substrate-binding protein
MRFRVTFMVIFCGLLSPFFAQARFSAQAQDATHGLAMHGAPALSSNFQHYQHPDAKALKGGDLRQAQLGSFDSLNPFSVRGNAAQNIRERVFESLLDRNYDEAFSLYGLLAQSVTTPEDRSSVSFTLRPQARFSDGMPVTSADVAFTLQLLKTQGRPNHRFYYSKVQRVEVLDAHRITLHFDPQSPDRELPLILGLMPILPQHIYENRNIQSASLELPIGSGPYIIEEITPGAQVRFYKQDDYWAQDLPVMAGRHNFARIIEDYFRDENTAFEAFKAGDIDIWFERNPQRWLSGYQFPAAKDGRITKTTIPLATPSGMRAFVLNTRRQALQSPALREALDLLFDFEWVNHVLYGGIYKRTQSYFGNTQLSASKQPASAAQMALLAPSPRDKAALEAGYIAPKSDGSGRDRRLRAKATALLQAAGYRFSGTQLHDPQGRKVSLEIIVQRREDERLALAWRRMLAQIGIELSVRLLDSSQYQRRLQTYDFDIIVYQYYASLSPGNEQAYYWGSEAANTQGSRNYAGIQDAGIDTAIQALTQASDADAFETAARALDRALMSGHYFVPLFHNPAQWVAISNNIETPARHSLYGSRVDSWWFAGTN